MLAASPQRLKVVKSERSTTLESQIYVLHGMPKSFGPLAAADM